MKRLFCTIFAIGLLTAATAAAGNAPAPAKKVSTDQRAAKARRQVIQDLRTRGSNVPAAFKAVSSKL